MKNLAVLFLTIVLLLGIGSGCTSKGGSAKTLDYERFVQVYIAALYETSKSAVTTPENPPKVNLHEVFSRFGTNEREFWATVDSYREQPEKWRGFFEDVSARIQKMSLENNKQKSQEIRH